MVPFVGPQAGVADGGPIGKGPHHAGTGQFDGYLDLLVSPTQSLEAIQLHLLNLLDLEDHPVDEIMLDAGGVNVALPGAILAHLVEAQLVTEKNRPAMHVHLADPAPETLHQHVGTIGEVTHLPSMPARRLPSTRFRAPTPSPNFLLCARTRLEVGFGTMQLQLAKIGLLLVLITAAFPMGAPASEATAGTDGQGLERQMVGYWAPNQKQMFDVIMKELGDDANARQMAPLIQAALVHMVCEIRLGEVHVHAIGQVKKSNYKITDVDPGKRTLTMMVQEEDGDPEVGTARIEGDQLTLKRNGETVILDRIDKKEFKKRKDAASQKPELPNR